MAAEAEALIHQLSDALRRNSRANSAEVVRNIIRVKPPLGARWKSMAAIAKKNGEVDDAIMAMTYYCETAGSAPAIQFEMAALLAQLGRLGEAERIMATLPAETPTAADYYYSSGTLALNLGKVDGARHMLREACKAAPASGQSWLALAMAGQMEAADLDALMAAKSDVAQTDQLENSAYHYALGKAFDQTGDFDSAFRCFSDGAQAMQGVRQYDFEADKADAANAAAGWQSVAHLLPAQENTGMSNTSNPIFVTGLPRSGTTLVEQILSSHSEVAGGEELGLMQIVTQDTGKTASDFSNFISRGGSPAALADIYRHLLRQRATGSGRFVDKSLNTSRFTGLIASIFPDAPIIWLRRDPLDCAWSAYRTWFLRGLEWSWSLSDIANHFAIEDALFTHWSNFLGERMLVVDYATLVQNPEDQIKRISNFCGLEVQSAQMRPHETDRPIKTASVMQVRQPIHTGAIGNSEAYHKYMAPFVAAYEAARSALPPFQ